MYQRYFEQVLPGVSWYRIRHEAEEIAQERAMNCLKHFPTPYLSGFQIKVPDDDRPLSLFKKIEQLQYRKLIAQIIAREFKASAMDVNGYNPMDSIAGVRPHLENLHLEDLGKPFHKVQGNPVDYGGNSLINATFDAYCSRDHRAMDIYARVIDTNEFKLDLVNKPAFWIPYKKPLRSPSEYWLMMIDARDWETYEDLVFIKHYFIDRNKFTGDVIRHAKVLNKAPSDIEENEHIVCKPLEHCQPAKVFEPHEVEKWIKLRDGLRGEG